jgi:hypothetical protein
MEGSVTCPRFPVAFRLSAVRFLAVLSRRGCPLSLRSAYRWLVFSTGP